jgi:hypothetical protein
MNNCTVHNHHALKNVTLVKASDEHMHGQARDDACAQDVSHLFAGRQLCEDEHNEDATYSTQIFLIVLTGASATQSLSCGRWFLGIDS